MRFKSLAIHGFKSFADKTVLEFPRGITAIVGPNGSGKSNVMDALRWVLGEQRAGELRGNDMEDVIFAGSVTRRSAGFAQVSLTLSDIPPELSNKWGTLSELAITRKIYRSGEREYLINGRRCRLKDIKELLMDTGVGARSISIIEQERVTRIVNSSPLELRNILEETAGIVRYKERRKDAEIRLKQTEENMLRIKDILSVLEADMQRLAVQAGELEKYRNLRSALRQTDKQIKAVEYAELIKDFDKHERSTFAAREKLTQAVGAHNAAIELETASLREEERLKGELRRLRAGYDTGREELARAESNLTRFESEGDAAQRLRGQTESDIKSAEERLDTLALRKLELDKEYAELTNHLQAFQTEAEELTARIAKLTEDASELDKPLKNAAALYYSISQRLTELNNKISLKQAEISNNKARRQRLLREEAGFDTERKSNLQRVMELSQSMARTEGLVTDLQAEYDEKSAMLSAREDEAFDIKTQMSELASSLSLAKKELALVLSEIQAKGIGGKEGANFIEKFGGRLYREEFPDQDAYILYSDLFIFDDDKKYPVIMAAGGVDFSFNFVFRQDLAQLAARDALVKVAEGLYLDGAIYRRTGKDNTGFLIMGLEKRQMELEETISHTESALKSRGYAAEELADELSLLKDETKKLSAELKAAEIKLAGIRTSLNHATEESRRIERGVKVVSGELQSLDEAEKSSATELAELEGERQLFQEKCGTAEAERSRLEAEQRETVRELEKVRQEKNNNNASLACFTEREKALAREAENLSNDERRINESIIALKKRLLVLADVNSAEYMAKHKAILDVKNELATKVLTIADEVSAMERTLAEQEEGAQASRKEIDACAIILRELDRQLAVADSKAENITAAMERLTADMWNEHDEILEDVYEEFATLAKPRELNAEKVRLAEQIDALGALNMAAEAEYNEKHTYYESQMAQMQDIEHSADNLSKLITEIDESTVQIFAETFNEVRKNFTEVFTKFFGDGTADLLLTEPADLLATGVELKVNPPGKKINNNNLLSGGEKALAALTLLFSLFLRKPTPFCFLDEVDAPLDDENAGRFINMLRLLSGETQFVVITHKHKTMGSADSLYGVTMQEGGVSCILSVELT